MLTLQNILDSDSLSTLVAKLNANFQSIALSNGGPQGIRGEQGIPGLPGKQGATGPSGPIGPSGPSFGGIIPFAYDIVNAGYDGLGQPGTGSGVPQSDQSYEFLTTSSSWGPTGTLDNQVWFDNNQLGWWKYLTQADPEPTDPNVGPDIQNGYYGATTGYTGAGWYFYPLNISAIATSLGTIWEADKTNYLGLIAPIPNSYASPSTLTNYTTQAPFAIPNARMTSKFGTVWISSLDKEASATGPGGGPDDNDTSLIFGWDYLANPRLNAGVDRSLFKMSIDGPRFFDNMKARGWRITDAGNIVGATYAVDGGAVSVPNSTTPAISPIVQAGALESYFIRPAYNVSIDLYAPLLYLSNRNDSVTKGGSLGYYQLSPGYSGAGQSFIHYFTTREDIDDFFDSGDGQQARVLTTSTNTAETFFDTRRFVTTNQFVNIFPQDTTNYTSLVESTGDKSPVFADSQNILVEWNQANAWMGFQGYHSVFAGNKLIENAADGPMESFGINQWIYENRQSWYGTSLYEKLPNFRDGSNVNPEEASGTQELIRSAGMMVRGKNAGGDGNYDGVLIYTANSVGNITNAYGADPDFDADYIENNHLLSLPTAYYSATRNLGVGTVAMDKAGVFEPSARFQSHADWRPTAETLGTIEDITDTLAEGSYSSTFVARSWIDYSEWVPTRRIKSGAFTIDKVSPALIYGIGEGGTFSDPAQWPNLATDSGDFDDWNNRGVFNDLLLGTVDSPYNEAAWPSQASTTLRPTSAIRYESFNYLGDINVERANPERNYGWAWNGAMRLGASPKFSGASAGNPTNEDEIGSNANFQNVEFQISLHPLSYTKDTSANAQKTMITGVGMHNLYPRTRLHLYGKNIYQEFRQDEAASPGFVEPGLAAGNSVNRDSWPNVNSYNQITIDYLGDSYAYNAAAYDYSYDYVVSIAGAAITQFTPNAKNNPVKESVAGVASTTRSTFNSTLNISNLNSTASILYGDDSIHGGSYNGFWDVDKYIGFNLYRDLLAKGDERGEAASGYFNSNGAYDQYASTWRTGEKTFSKGASGTSSNGGSAILTDSYGKMGFSFIPSYRDGGLSYRGFEQRGIGTREIVNNIKVIFDTYGNIGIGQAGGYDEDAYPSLYWNPSTMKINYLPNANGAAVSPEMNPPAAYSSLGASAWLPGIGDYYSWPLDGAYSPYSANAVNAQATQGEYIRFEIGAEKAMARPGHTPEKRGYGYPGWLMDVNFFIPTGTGGIFHITDDASNTFANRYLNIAIGTAGWGGVTYTFTFDNLGRVMSLTTDGTPSVPGTNYWLDTQLLPHPSEFGENGPFRPGGNVGAYPWTSGLSYSIIVNGTVLTGSNKIWIPTGAVAASPYSYEVAGDGEISNFTFERDELQPANMRLNNFIYGDGYEFVRSNGESADLIGVTDASTETTVKIFEERTRSPKIILTFGAVDYDAMSIANFNTTERDDYISAGLAPLMKVTTVIESDQTDTSLRTYTIPKADNTGGSFMVITDHMGQTEKADPGLAALPQNADENRIVLEKVVAHEVVRTGTLNTTQSPNPGFLPVSASGEPLEFTVWPTSYEMLPIHYVQGANTGSLACEQIMNDPVETRGVLGAQIRRTLDGYWNIDNSEIDARTKTPGNVRETFKKSEIRYRRLNSDYVLLDFNVDIEALAFNTLIDCRPQENIWNSHGLMKNIVGDDGGFFVQRNEQLNAYTHSPYAPGHLIDQIDYYNSGVKTTANKNVWVGVDARWVQYVRFSYNVQDDSFSTGVDDPFYYEREFGGGPNFANWNEYRAWYHGTATVGSNLSDSNLTTYANSGEAANGVNYSDENLNLSFYNFTTSGTGAGYYPPSDSSPYSVWNNGSLNTSVTADGLIKYWNGRLNDWFSSRWSQSSSSAGTPTTTRYFSQGDDIVADPTNGLRLGSTPISGTGYEQDISVYYTPDGVVGQNYPGYVAGGGLGTWQNNESTVAGYSVYPNITTPTSLGILNYPINPYINQYAYKMLWKWYEPFRFTYTTSSPGYIYENLYTEHPLEFDRIVQRSFGDQAWVRSGNIQWKVTPVGKGVGFYQGLPEINPISFTKAASNNVTFVIEVMFDQPIFVSGRTVNVYDDAAELKFANADATVTGGGGGNEQEVYQHILNQRQFSGYNPSKITAPITNIKPYSNLTLRGQAVVSYRKTRFGESYFDFE